MSPAEELRAALEKAKDVMDKTEIREILREYLTEELGSSDKTSSYRSADDRPESDRWLRDYLNNTLEEILDLPEDKGEEVKVEEALPATHPFNQPLPPSSSDEEEEEAATKPEPLPNQEPLPKPEPLPTQESLPNSKPLPDQKLLPNSKPLPDQKPQQLEMENRYSRQAEFEREHRYGLQRFQEEERRQEEEKRRKQERAEAAAATYRTAKVQPQTCNEEGQKIPTWVYRPGKKEPELEWVPSGPRSKYRNFSGYRYDQRQETKGHVGRGRLLPKEALPPIQKKVPPRRPQTPDRQNGCWSCGSLDHRYNRCPTMRSDFCRRCGRLDVTVKTCPKCGPTWKEGGPHDYWENVYYACQ